MNELLAAIGILAFFTLLLLALAWSDDECEKRGGTVVVISEHQAKGTMKHTECKQ
jgi:hypothetical protein